MAFMMLKRSCGLIKYLINTLVSSYQVSNKTVPVDLFELRNSTDTQSTVCRSTFSNLFPLLIICLLLLLFPSDLHFPLATASILNSNTAKQMNQRPTGLVWIQRRPLKCSYTADWLNPSWHSSPVRMIQSAKACSSLHLKSTLLSEGPPERISN